MSFLQRKTFDKIERAKSESQYYHRNDKYGEHGYFEYHLMGVYEKVVKAGFGEEHQLVAILHDIHEDHKYPIDLIISIYGYDVGKAVEAISFRKGHETRDEYYSGCEKNEIAKVVKYFDSQFNREQSELEGNTKRSKYYSKIEERMKW